MNAPATLASLVVGAGAGALAFALLEARDIGNPGDLARAEAQAIIDGEFLPEASQPGSAPKTLLPEPPPPPAIVALLRHDGATVKFIGATPGLVGYRLTRGPDDAGYTLYVTPSGHAVVGTLYGPDGILLTADQIAAALPDKAAPAPASTPPSVTRPAASRLPEPSAPDTGSVSGTKLQAPPVATGTSESPADTAPWQPPPTTGFTLGTAGPEVTIFADPQCPFSRSTVARFAAAALEGELRLTVIPVALLGADSAWQALAAVGEEGAEAWFERRAEEPTPETASAVRANNAALAATGFEVVPIIRLVTSGGAWRDRPGAVDDVARFMEAAR